ncbi:hypothetical protein H6784_04100 [Candidatus Nomurabacteria bacterium]|nr:hypothetical protein [Candidatus Kaiserbacteria bacterium]MCB9814570.1 hypothetical protein [Candidatus Nomurabacteria bacterium]
MKKSSRIKVWLTCPEPESENLRMQIGDADISNIGNYSHCTFVTKGKGYFKPNSQANPTIGESGQLEEVDEVAIQFICEENKIPKLIEIVKIHHPYEEVAIDFVQLLEME